MSRTATRPSANEPALPFTDTERGTAAVGTFVGIDGVTRIDTEPSLLDALEEISSPILGPDRPWFVVVERCDYDYNPLPDYVVGPYATEAEAEEECQSECSITYCLLTIDAKAERYIAGGDCYWTQEPPTVPNECRIIPPDPECPMDQITALDRGILALNTLTAPDATDNGDFDRLLDQAEEAVTVLAALRETLAAESAATKAEVSA